jgi:DNA repair protein RadC
MQPNLLNYNLAEIEVSYRTKVKASERRKITSSKDAESIFREIWSSSMEFKEEFYIILLNRANQVLGWYKVSEGGMSGTVVDPKLIFSIALKGLSSSLILAHNHPSSNLKPSNEDINLTKRLKEAGALLEIPVLDHLILTTDGYYSFGDEGMM